MTAAGIVTLRSAHDFATTVRRLDDELAARGVPVFARIDHTANAVAAGLSMPPAVVVVFGNPRAGTPLMLRAPDLALDLPLRILVRGDGDGVAVSYRDPAATVDGFGVPADPLQAVAVIAAAVAAA